MYYLIYVLFVISEMADARKRCLSNTRQWKVATRLLEATSGGDNGGFDAIPPKQSGSALEIGEVDNEVL